MKLTQQVASLQVLGTGEAKASMKEAQREAKKGKGGRKITARCWMAEDFPMSLKQLVPVLDVVGYANKHVARVGFHYYPAPAQFTHPLALSSKI